MSDSIGAGAFIASLYKNRSISQGLPVGIGDRTRYFAGK